jgi:hypothetical protein
LAFGSTPKSPTANLIQSLLDTHLVEVLNVPFIADSSVEDRMDQFDTGIDAQHGAKRIVGLGTQVSFGINMIATKDTVVQEKPTESLVGRQGLRQDHTRFIRETVLHL